MYVFVCVGGTDTEEESAHKVNSGEENSPAAPAGIRTRNLWITSLALQPTSYPGSLLIIIKEKKMNKHSTADCVGMSNLNHDLTKRHLSTDPACSCGHPNETAEQFLL